MKEVLQDALSLAVLAGKAAEAGEDERYDNPQNPGAWRKNQFARRDRFMREAWEKLATLPGDVGECARAELARMKAEN